jgi:hypothetical protein
VGGEGGSPAPGWYDDPHGQHRHRWWDGGAWTEQVSDGAPAESAGRRRLPPVPVVVALLVVLAAVVTLLVLGGGDDGGSGGSGSAAAVEEDAGGGTGTFDSELSDDEPAATFPVPLEAGDALRVAVDGVDAAISVAADDEAETEGFEGLVATGDSTYELRTFNQLSLVAGSVLSDEEQEEITEDAGLDLDQVYEDIEDATRDAVPGLEDAGVVFAGTDRSSDEVEGLQLVAPTSGTYTVIVHGEDEGEFDVTLEVEGGDDEDLDPEDIEYLDYLAHYGEHVDFFCDEGFFGGDPEDVTNYGPTVCDEDTLDGVLAGELNGDFTNDFGAEDEGFG